MRILFITENFPPETNASATRVYERALHWVRWGHEVTVITGFPNFPEGKLHEGYRQGWRKVEQMDGITVIRMPTYIAANEGFARRILDFVSFMITGTLAGWSVKRPDVVAATSPQFFVAVAGWMVALGRGRPYVLEISDLWPKAILATDVMKPGLAIRLLEKLELFLYRRARRVVLLTSAFKDDVVGRGIPAEKLDVIRNGVELNLYAPRPRDAAIAEELDLRDRFVVGYIGTLGLSHDLANVLRAAELTRDDPGIVYLFVGAGADRAPLMQQAAEQGLTNVRFVPRQPKGAMPAYWSQCDLALVHLVNAPAMRDVIPSKIFEAWAMGLPVLLVSPDGEASDLVAEEAAGVHVQAGDPAALAQAVRALKADPDQRRRLSQAALTAAPRYTREEQARRFVDSMTKATGRA